MNEELLSGSLSDNLLTLIIFDDAALPLLSTSLEAGMFESDFYKAIVRAAFDYYHEFRAAPGEHIADLFETKLYGKASDKEAQVYKDILVKLHRNRDNVNRDYVLSRLTKFVRQQTLKEGIIAAYQEIKNDNADAAEQKLTDALNKQLKVFDPGIWLTDTTRSLKFLSDPIPVYPLGIPPLDQIGFGPAPGELLVILAPPNRGKSQFCVHVAKMCAIQRLRVLYISLEMSEEKVAQRFFQSLFSISKRVAEVVYSRFESDRDGKLTGFRVESLIRPTLRDTGIADVLAQKILHFRNRLKLIIKRFPTGALNIRGLEAYLDSMERFYNFVPDVLILDYADLLQLDQANLRVSTGGVYKELRRIAVERNMAVVSPTQSNRLGEDAKVLSLKHLAEDYSKAATADNVVAYCQSSMENRLGLARLFVAKARDEEREQTVLISQAYRMSQFCMDSYFISDSYWSLLDAHAQPPAAALSTPVANTQSESSSRMFGGNRS